LEGYHRPFHSFQKYLIAFDPGLLVNKEAMLNSKFRDSSYGVSGLSGLKAIRDSLNPRGRNQKDLIDTYYKTYPNCEIT